jgi:hypothetical protein
MPGRNDPGQGCCVADAAEQTNNVTAVSVSGPLPGF